MVVLCDGLNCKYQFVLSKNQNQLEKYQVFEHDDMNDILGGNLFSRYNDREHQIFRELP